MEQIEWDDADKVQGKTSPCIETLATEALTLKRVLSKYLPTASTETIIRRVFVDYQERFSKAFEAATVQTNAGQAR
jgi:vacuolar protein sorting-associated protein 54